MSKKEKEEEEKPRVIQKKNSAVAQMLPQAPASAAQTKTRLSYSKNHSFLALKAVDADFFAYACCIEAENCMITANQCIVRGNGNTLVSGGNNTLIGNFNKVKSGEFNFLIGEQCDVSDTGTRNFINENPAAHKLLHEMNYSKVHNLYGGMDLMEEAGFWHAILLVRIVFPIVESYKLSDKPWPQLNLVAFNSRTYVDLYSLYNIGKGEPSLCDLEECGCASKSYTDAVLQYNKRLPTLGSVKETIEAAIAFKDTPENCLSSFQIDILKDLFPSGIKRVTIPPATMHEPSVLNALCAECALDTFTRSSDCTVTTATSSQQGVIKSGVVPHPLPGIPREHCNVIPSIEDSEASEGDVECKICLEFKACISTKPCNHMCMCKRCATELYKNKAVKCPVCTLDIKKFRAVYT